jgi:hypothetical protein
MIYAGIRYRNDVLRGTGSIRPAVQSRREERSLKDGITERLNRNLEPSVNGANEYLPLPELLYGKTYAISTRGENVRRIITVVTGRAAEGRVLQLPHMVRDPAVAPPLGDGLQVYQGPICSFNRSCYDSIIVYMDKCAYAGPEVETFLRHLSMRRNFHWARLGSLGTGRKVQGVQIGAQELIQDSC